MLNEKPSLGKVVWYKIPFILIKTLNADFF